ncbi:MAG: diguanylate cyclase [Deltaproteobacteria bacterium]|nr:diguanylate cyclase [Deltaproteobacteria bacterium]
MELTDSEIGYLHFVNDDQSTIELVTWSRSTLQYCTAVFDRHYPIDAAGVWADTARLGVPVIHNDYPSLPDRRGYPAGHAHLVRHLGVPVMVNGQSRMLMGVGNKEAPYGPDDAQMIERVARRVWSLVERRRALDALTRAEARARDLQHVASVAGWSWDPGAGRFRLDEVARAMLGWRKDRRLPSTLDEFLELVDPACHAAVRGMLDSSSPRRELRCELEMVRGDGSRFRAVLRGRPIPRPRGREPVFEGVLQDLTDQQEFEKLRHLAFHDGLTGLSNREHLVERLERLRHDGRRHSDELVAVHFIDLDLFKGVNDTLGHQAGDEVLKIVAERLVQTTRREDLTVRMGGDEFVVIQFGVRARGEALALGRKLIDAVRRPIQLEAQVVQVGASVGIALGRTPLHDVAALLAAADAALYQSKAAGGNVATVDDDREITAEIRRPS